MDVRVASIVVVRMMDGAKPQSPPAFEPAEFRTYPLAMRGLRQTGR
jgi:hypothetical protein